MRIVAISRVMNEADIIEAFVRHTLSAVADHLLIMNHGSTDETLSILHCLKSEGLSIDILESDAIDYSQDKHMTFLMREAVFRHGADWVFPLDADEFMIVKDKNTLIQTLQNDSQAETPRHIYWRTYVPDSSDSSSEINPARRIRHHLLVEPLSFAKVVIPKELVHLPTVTLALGNHHVIKDNSLCESDSVRDIYLAHFPIRSAGQFVSKVVISYLRYRTTSNHNSGFGFHYNYPFELLKNSFKVFSNNINELARQYCVPLGEEFAAETVLNPIPYRGGELKFTKRYDVEQTAISNVLSFAERLAKNYADLSAPKSLNSTVKNEEGSPSYNVKTLDHTSNVSNLDVKLP